MKLIKTISVKSCFLQCFPSENLDLGAPGVEISTQKFARPLPRACQITSNVLLTSTLFHFLRTLFWKVCNESKIKQHCRTHNMSSSSSFGDLCSCCCFLFEKCAREGAALGEEGSYHNHSGLIPTSLRELLSLNSGVVPTAPRPNLFAPRTAPLDSRKAALGLHNSALELENSAFGLQNSRPWAPEQGP